jgi:gliding motility-associated-like protein
MKSFGLIIILLVSGQNAYAQWKKSNGPEAGAIRDILEFDGYLFASAGPGGVYVTTDNGLNWVEANNGLPYFPFCYSLTHFGSTLYASISNHGVFKSVNYGQNWIPINQGIEKRTIYSLLVNANDIYGCDSQGGLYYSPDAGQTWEQRNGGFINNQIVRVAFAGSKLLAAVSGNVPGLYTSTDKGRSWSKLAVNATQINNMVVADNAIYVVGGNPTLISRDFGATWTTSLIGTTGFHILTGIYAQGDRVVVGAGDSTLYVSEDEGRNWVVISNLPYPGAVNSLRYTNNRYYIAGQEGFYFSPDNGMTWQARSKGLRNHIISHLLANDSIVVAGTYINGFFISKDQGYSWTEINDGLLLREGYGYLEGIRVMGVGWVNEKLTGGVFTKGIYQSTDFGQTWIQKLNTSGELLSTMLCDTKRIFTVSQSKTSADYFQYTSLDGGNTWARKPTTTFINSGIRDGLLKGDTIIIGNWSNVMISTDFGNTWRTSNFTEPSGTNDMLFLDTWLFVSTYKGIYRTPDLGYTWTKLQDGLPEGETNGLTFHEGKLFAGSTKGVFVSYDSGNYWLPWNKDLGNVETSPGSSFGTFPLTTDSMYVYAGTYGQSVWQRKHDKRIDIPLPDVFICKGEQANLNLPAGSSGIKWTTLSDTTVALSTSTVLTVNPLETADYRVKLKYGQFSTADTVTVFVYPEINVNLGKDTVVCGNQLQLDAGSQAFSITWQDNASNRFYCVSNPGVYSVQVENQFGCKASDDIKVSFAKEPTVDLGEDIVVCNDFYPIKAGWGDYQFLWSTGAQDSVFTPLTSGKYWVTVKNKCGQSTDTITVTQIEDIFFSNVVTANGDGKNDHFYVTTDDQTFSVIQASVTVQIFNRWGEKIYNSNKYQNEWPLGDSHLVSGVYYFAIDIATCPSIKGWIQVLKN